MIPTKPRDANVVMRGDGDEVQDLPVVRVQYADGMVFYSTWKPSLRERLQLLLGQPVVLGIYGDGMPPVTVQVGEEAIAR